MVCCCQSVRYVVVLVLVVLVIFVRFVFRFVLVIFVRFVFLFAGVSDPDRTVQWSVNQS
jgi:hypothetical protein